VPGWQGAPELDKKKRAGTESGKKQEPKKLKIEILKNRTMFKFNYNLMGKVMISP
jgi:hypothetical protein